METKKEIQILKESIAQINIILSDVHKRLRYLESSINKFEKINKEEIIQDLKEEDIFSLDWDQINTKFNIILKEIKYKQF